MKAIKRSPAVWKKRNKWLQAATTFKLFNTYSYKEIKACTQRHRHTHKHTKHYTYTCYSDVLK